MARSESNKIPKEQTISNIYDSFKENLYAVQLYFNNFGELALTEDKGELTRTSELIKEHLGEPNSESSILTEDSNEKEKATERLLKFVKVFNKQPPISAKNFELLSNSSFLMLNNYFEYLLADLLSYHYSKFRNSLSSKEFRVSLKELEEYNDVAELSNALILKEVESMLVELTFDQLLTHFEKDLAIELNTKIVNWEIIKECRERRHLIVHNSSVVNKKYLLRTSNPDNLKVGDKIRVSKKYFESAHEEFRIAGLLLILNCWGKWDKEKANKAMSEIVQETFSGLQSNQTNFVYRFSEYLSKIEPRNEDQEDLLLRSKFNRCIALKRLDKKDELKKTLKEIKVGTASPVFKLAHAILSDKDDSTIKGLVKKSYTLGEIDLDSYLEWPMFEFIRDKEVLNLEITEMFNCSKKE